MRVPLVGVVIAVYQPNIAFLQKQMESILNQTYSNFFIILVDDGSSDEKKREIHSLVRSADKVFHYFLENVGPVQNFGRGIRLALDKGAEYIALSDQDDVWELNKLELLADFIRSANCDLVHSDLQVIDELGNTLSRSIFEMESRRKIIQTRAQLFLRNNVTGCSCLFSRKLAEQSLPFPEVGYPPEFYHDHWLACFAFDMQGIAFLDRPLVKYRQHGGNLVGAGKFKNSSRSFYQRLRTAARAVSRNLDFLQSSLENRRAVSWKASISSFRLNFFEVKILILWKIGKIWVND